MLTDYKLHTAGHHDDTNAINVGKMERAVSLITGIALILLGRRLRRPGSIWAILLGGDLIYRGATGFCWIYQAFGVNRAVDGTRRAVSIPHEQGIRVEARAIVHRPVEEVFAFWRDFRNLPRFMEHLKSVEVLDAQHSHWTARAPARASVSWDTVIVNEKPNELIAWRSTGDAMIANTGAVIFRPVLENRATVVEVKLEYVPPAGEVGAFIAKLFGREPRLQVPEDLQRLKQILEIPLEEAVSGPDQSAVDGPTDEAQLPS